MFRYLAAGTLTCILSLVFSLTAHAATSQRVVFESNGQRLVGDLYLPDSGLADAKLPGVVVTGAWTTVKEQMAGRYAAELADRGYAALAFDFRNWGQSEGDRRFYENPELKTQDIHAAARFMADHERVDADRLAGLGICASSGYMARAVAGSDNLQALVLVAPWLHDAGIVEQIYGGAEQVDALIAVSRHADREFEAHSTNLTVPVAGTDDPTAVMQGVPYYTDPATGMIPEWDNHFSLGSWEPWLTYDGVAASREMGETPVQLIHSEKAAAPQGTKRFYEQLEGPKNIRWIEGVTQFGFYHEDEPIDQAVDTADEFLRNVLSAE